MLLAGALAASGRRWPVSLRPTPPPIAGSCDGASSHTRHDFSLLGTANGAQGTIRYRNEPTLMTAAGRDNANTDAPQELPPHLLHSATPGRGPFDIAITRRTIDVEPRDGELELEPGGSTANSVGTCQPSDHSNSCVPRLLLVWRPLASRRALGLSCAQNQRGGAGWAVAAWVDQDCLQLRCWGPGTLCALSSLVHANTSRSSLARSKLTPRVSTRGHTLLDSTRPARRRPTRGGLRVCSSQPSLTVLGSSRPDHGSHIDGERRTRGWAGVVSRSYSVHNATARARVYCDSVEPQW
ncbi:uncharacterized protein C8Q71DRAFT_120086 [Rhodofomes roseus]|uniref:Uncharacterized protein n=1 Tax=Rhodofomes roseus TaxID=34475 RepID=A0ABQ8KE90_9APHY|nr:uncharacterized protein C8Q71DRAFT_120086 [Rhodofomes roseus]KAH9835444.1 hypothetical protein C8Q71DRAFT_120086 [Rhodofomes roseus]